MLRRTGTCHLNAGGTVDLFARARKSSSSSVVSHMSDDDEDEVERGSQRDSA